MSRTRASIHLERDIGHGVFLGFDRLFRAQFSGVIPERWRTVPLVPLT
jgi:hypothetical protein